MKIEKTAGLVLIGEGPLLIIPETAFIQGLRTARHYRAMIPASRAYKDIPRLDIGPENRNHKAGLEVIPGE